MIKTLLVSPPFSLEQRYGKKMKSFGAQSEPLGLCYLAANLEANGYPVEILDAAADGISAEEVAARIKDGGYGLVGVSFMTPMFDAVRSLSDAIKRAAPEAKIAVGGPHSTALPLRTIEELPSVDFACVGEGEITIVDMVRHLMGEMDVDAIHGIAYRLPDGMAASTLSRKSVSDLDSLPKPARHMLSMEKYTLTASRTKGSRYCPTVIVARGCPFSCSYCSHTFGRSFRRHSIERILDEIRDLIREHDVDQVNIEADTLTINKKFVTELCEGLIEADLGIRWTCESRVDTIDESMLRLMKKAGCWQVSLGIETGSQRLLDSIDKGQTKEKIRAACRLTKEVGISIRGFFMLGLPSETREESFETIEFAKELDPDWAQFTVTIPYPGTPMFNQLEAEDKLRHYNWGDYNTWGGWADRALPFVEEGRNEQEVKAIQKKAMRAFYLRPKVFARFLRSISSFGDVMKYAEGFFVLIWTALESVSAKTILKSFSRSRGEQAAS